MKSFFTRLEVMWAAAAFGALLLTAAPIANAQDKGKLCPYCKTTGKVANEFYETYKHLEEKAKYCSFCIEKDKAGRGLPWVPCKRCKNKPLQAKAQAEFALLAKERLDWVAARRKIDEETKVREPLLHLETEHFLWAWNIPRFKGSDKKSYDMHRGLHLYAERMEKYYDDWQRVHKVTDKDNVNTKHQIFCYESQRASTKACNLYAQIATPNGKASKQGNPSVYVTWWDRSKRPTDEDFHLELIHNVNHLFTATYKNIWWLHECAVAYEGGSHWWEIYYFGRASTRCFVEADSGAAWRDYKWQSVVKKGVLADRHPEISDVLTKPGTSLNSVEHPYAWSYIDYMMHLDPHKVMDFYLVIKEKKHPREAIKKAFGVSIPKFEADWMEWVIDTYSIKAESPAIPKRLRRR